MDRLLLKDSCFSEWVHAANLHETMLQCWQHYKEVRIPIPISRDSRFPLAGTSYLEKVLEESFFLSAV
jgi:hypothetical protein